MRIVLAGNANVGKSVLMNRLTGVGVIVSNYPGTTVDISRGEMLFGGKKLEIIDLPGTYSLDGGSEDETVAIRTIIEEKPDVIINVIDATNLERNLYLTLQLIELGFPMVIALNQMDRVHERGMEIDSAKLEKLLGIPVIPVTAISGNGVHELINAAVTKARIPKFRIRYDYHIEQAIKEVAKRFRKNCPLPRRTIALGLLLGNPVIEELVTKALMSKVLLVRKKIEELHKESVLVHASRDRFGVCGELSSKVVTRAGKESIHEILSQLTLSGWTSILIMILIFLSSFYTLISVGGFLEEGFITFFDELNPIIYSLIGANFLTEGVVVGVEAGISIVIPYITTFYIILGVLEDTGYLPRVATLLDNFMHRIGLHGKAIIPILLGFGCNVPAILSTRILSSRKERLITAYIISLAIPCSAQTSIILGLVGHYLGVLPALAVYSVSLVLLLVAGKILAWYLPGRQFGLVIELPPYRMPDPAAVISKTYFRVKEFFFIALPLIVLGSIVLAGVKELGLLSLVQAPMSLVTDLLGLPHLTAVPLIYGILRKEMTLETIALLAGTTDFSRVFTPAQMFVFSLVMAVYIPCIATIAALLKEFGLKDTVLITVLTILTAVLIGFVANQFILFTHVL